MKVSLFSLFCLVVGLASAWLPGQSSAPVPTAAAQRIPVLIVDGINNHDWRPTTAWIKRVLEESGRFAVDVSTTPLPHAAGPEWETWRPDFGKYRVVVGNFNGGHRPDGVRWPAAVEQAFETYVRGGGGYVSFHAANNAFLRWKAYNEMIGLGWRDKSFGPSLVIDEKETRVIVPTGEGRNPGHGARHDFEISVLEPLHPITHGFPKRWLHRSEQLTHGQHGLEDVVRSDALTILTYAWSKDVQERQPLDWVRAYGEGRVYTTMLGHTWKAEDNRNLRGAGFHALFLRGVEWAATGAVTLGVPADCSAEMGGP